MSEGQGSRREWSLAAGVAALVAFLPFLRGALGGQAFFFRDLSRQFFPLRDFALEGLRRGEVRYWNPLLNEGVPLSLPALSYPLDLLQLAFTGEPGFSLLLALHVPLAACAFVMLARGLGLRPLAASAGAMVYALGGFALSTLNFYVYAQAVAWAPLVALGILRVALGRRRSLGLAALFIAVCLSTTGAEIAAQAVLLGLVLAVPSLSFRALARCAASLALGFGLAAPTLVALRAAVAGSARAEGFPTDVVLAQSLHPLSLVQALVGNWHGNLANLANEWWGSNFFPSGFPYVLSIYLGACVLALALVGLLAGSAQALRLGGLASVGLVVAVGRWAGLAAVVDALPFVHAFRHPSKAFFTVHVAVALLVAFGLEALTGPAAARAWARLTAVAAFLGGLLVLVPAAPLLIPVTTRWFLAGFLPPSYDWNRRYAVGAAIAGDAALGGLLAVAATGIAVLVLRGVLEAPRARLLLVALVAADLLRTGAGLNPTVSAAFYATSPEMRRVLLPLRGTGRVFACEPEAVGAYFEARFGRPGDHDAWSFAVARETLAPATNVGVGIATALSRDMTMMVPVGQVLDLDELGPGGFASVVDRLRRAGVAHVACLAALDNPQLTTRAELFSERTAPLTVHVYDLADPLPLRAVARDVLPAAGPAGAEAIAARPAFQAEGGSAVEGAAAMSGASGTVTSRVEAPDHIELDVESDRPAMLIVRDAFAAGWSATVDGSAAPILRADGRHRAVRVPAGHSHVAMSYRPPGLPAAILIALVSLALSGFATLRRFDG